MNITHDVAFIHTCKDELKAKLNKEPVSSTVFNDVYTLGWQGIVYGYPYGLAETFVTKIESKLDYEREIVEEKFESLTQLDPAAHQEVFVDSGEF